MLCDEKLSQIPIEVRAPHAVCRKIREKKMKKTGNRMKVTINATHTVMAMRWNIAWFCCQSLASAKPYLTYPLDDQRTSRLLLDRSFENYIRDWCKEKKNITMICNRVLLLPEAWLDPDVTFSLLLFFLKNITERKSCPYTHRHQLYATYMYHPHRQWQLYALEFRNPRDVNVIVNGRLHLPNRGY